jgi:hypothetical protein
MILYVKEVLRRPAIRVGLEATPFLRHILRLTESEPQDMAEGKYTRRLHRIGERQRRRLCRLTNSQEAPNACGELFGELPELDNDKHTDQ